MKKLIAIFLTIAMTFMLSACSESGNNDTDSKPSEPSKVQDPDDHRDTEYDEVWLDTDVAKKLDGEISRDFKISEIYADCFIATTVVPLPNQYKINGALSDDWCVGDQVYVTMDNVYEDRDNDRIEGDLVNIEVSNLELDPTVNYKPVIYLYPEKETEVSVSLDLNGGLTCTYPSYNDGWVVTAKPDGTLVDQNGQSYNYLYWEGETYARWDTSKGFCVKGDDTAEFLEKALSELGLNRREANEFIVFWLPLMQNNPYNIISFQTDAYTDAAVLDINPYPDTLIRVFMTYKATDRFVELEAQTLTAPERNGFTAVEWGGTEIK